MSKKGHTRRRESKRKLKVSKSNKPKTYRLDEPSLISRIEKKNKFQKRYLILCEGETEEAYFSGLKNNFLLREKFKAVQIEIIAPSSRKNSTSNNSLIDNSIKGMVWEAMKRKKQAKKNKNPFDEIWIVIDNDERNSYIISQRTIHRSKEVLIDDEIKLLSNNKDTFFLSTRHYEDFLKFQIGLSSEKANKIIELTDKNTLFEALENEDPKFQFFSDNKLSYGQNFEFPADEKDFDPKWKEWLKVAYSCRTFENWVILHFEPCANAFTISKEIEITTTEPFDPSNSIHYIWQNFNSQFCKGFESKKIKKINVYNCLKPQPFEEKFESEIEAQAVIDRIKSAMLNSFWLRKKMEAELLKQNGKYYEVNPFTNVNYLLSSLLEKNILYGQLGEVISYEELEITITWDSISNTISGNIVNNSNQKRLLINNTNVKSHFKILSVSPIQSHSIIEALAIDNTINIPPGDSSNRIFSITTSNNQTEEKKYIVFQNQNLENYLYIPI